MECTDEWSIPSTIPEKNESDVFASLLADNMEEEENCTLSVQCDPQGNGCELTCTPNNTGISIPNESSPLRSNNCCTNGNGLEAPKQIPTDTMQTTWATNQQLHKFAPLQPTHTGPFTMPLPLAIAAQKHQPSTHLYLPSVLANHQTIVSYSIS